MPLPMLKSWSSSSDFIDTRVRFQVIHFVFVSYSFTVSKSTRYVPAGRRAYTREDTVSFISTSLRKRARIGYLRLLRPSYRSHSLEGGWPKIRNKRKQKEGVARN